MLGIVVIGGGLAAATAVTELREQGFDGPITLLAEEEHTPYERPPLSKAVLLGEKEPESAIVKPTSWYDEHDVDLRVGTSVDRIDREAHQVHAGGEVFDYDKLLIATGARPRRLAMADDSGAPVSYLRTMDDSTRLRALFRPGLRLGIIGGGWIGLEVASAARNAEAAVTVLESLELPLLRVLGPEVAQVFADLHEEHGVRLITGAEITEITFDAPDIEVTLADGVTAIFDQLVVGVGVQPNVELAEAAGITVDDGIRTDDHLRSSDPDVFAAGDVASADHPVLGSPVAGRALGHRHPARQGGRGQPRGRRRRRGRPALLLHRPVRLRHGVRRQPRSGRIRPGDPARRRTGQELHRVVAQGRPGRGRHAGQRLGRDRPGPPDRRERPSTPTGWPTSPSPSARSKSADARAGRGSRRTPRPRSRGGRTDPTGRRATRRRAHSGTGSAETSPGRCRAGPPPTWPVRGPSPAGRGPLR